MTARGWARRWASPMVVLALLLAACGGAATPADPTEALVDAVERSFSGAFAFEVQVELDAAAETQMPSDDVPIAALLDSLEIAGHTAGDGTLALMVAAMGQDLFELRQTDATHTYLRTDAGRIAETFGTPLDREEMLSEAQQAPEAVGQMLTGLLDGRWVGIVGERSQGPDVDAMMLMGGIDPSEVADAQREAFGDSPAEFVRRFTGASFADSGGGGDRVLDVRLHARAMAEAMYTTMLAVFGDEHRDDEQVRRDLERIPETVGGITVEVSNRLVDRVTIDVFEVARSLDPSSGDEPAGSLRLVADISEHGTAGPVAVPDGASEVAAEDLGQHHPGAFLPLGNLSSALMWPLMGLMPIGMSSSVQSVETTVELEAPPAEVTAVPRPPPGHPSPGAVPPPEPGEPPPAAPMSLESSPHAGPSGTVVTITVEGFEHGPVEVRWNPGGPVLATAEGPDFTVEVTVPADATPGQHTIVLEATSADATRSAGISFEVTS